LQYKRVILSVYFIFIVGFSLGQINNKLLFDRLFIPDGLARNPITDITQGPFGLMWFTTNDGLHKFDGYTFETYDIDSYPLESVTYNSLHFLNDSILLVGSGNAGLNKFNRHTKSFTPVKPDILSINGIHEDQYGDIWINCGEEGIYSYLRKEDSLKLEVTDPIHAVAINPAGDLHYARNNTLYTLRGDEEIIIGHLDKGHLITSIGYNGSNIWVGTFDQGLFEFGSTGLVKILDEPSKINAIYQDHVQNIWVLTHKNGIFLKSKNGFTNLKRDFYNNHTLSSDRVLTIHQDNNDVVWLGTSSGINKYDPYKTKFSLFRNDPFNSNTLTSNLIRGIKEDGEGQLWVATEDGAINVLNKQRTAFKSLKLTLSGHEQIVPYDFYETNEGEMLVASSVGFLVVSKDLEDLKPHKTVNYKALDKKRVRSIVPYDDNNLLLLSQGRVYRYNIEKDSLQLIVISPDQSKQETQSINQFARTIYVDQNKNIWVGSYGAVARVDLETNQAKYYYFDKERGSMVMFIQQHGQNLWVGTFNGGLIRVDSNSGAFKIYTTDNGLPNNAIYSAIPDAQGNLWLSTNKGIAKFNIKEETVKSFDTRDGVQGQEFNRLAFCKLKNGEIAMGGINGLNIFHPRLIKNNPHFPVSIILNAEVLNEFDKNEKSLHPTLSLVGKNQLNLSHQQNFLRFNFCASHFSVPQDNKFYYQLENFDKDWVYGENKNSATYTGLKHGTYTFKVRSINPDGLEELQHASVKVHISAPFWMKWWFYAGILMAVFVIGYVTLSRRMAQNKAVKQLLEQEIQRRTKELKKSKDELSDLNQKKDFIFSILSHDLRSPLTTLEGFLGLLINNFDRMKQEEVITHASAIKNSVGKSLDLIDNTLYWSLSQLGNISFTPTQVNLSTLFEKVNGLYGLTAKKKRVKLTFHNSEKLNVFADENMAYIIIRNLVSNAIKFTPSKKEVKVFAAEEDNMVVITVKDQGEGVERDIIDKLFDEKPNISKRGTSNEKGAGIGLILCKKFVDMHDGEIYAQNDTIGASFIVKLPTG